MSSKYILVLICSLVSKSSFSEGMASTAGVKLKIISSINISNTKGISFAASLSSQTVDPEDSSSAKFTLSGESSKSYNIVLPQSRTAIKKKYSSGNKKLIVNNFTSSKSGNSGVLNSKGIDSFKIGASTESFGGRKVAEAFSSLFTVTIVY